MCSREVGFSNAYGRHVFCRFQLSWPDIKWFALIKPAVKYFSWMGFCVKVNTLGIFATAMWPNNYDIKYTLLLHHERKKI